ncbi:MAG: PEP-CTERM sorting domain-containing protein, partial [Cephaloticoccus sp.]|nr:PEP-CTERM sorting domain-containing protein [Cephaloticoccus sp.]
ILASVFMLLFPSIPRPDNTMKLKSPLLVAVLFLVSCGIAQAQFTIISMEVNNGQTGAATTVASGAVFFAEVQEHTIATATVTSDTGLLSSGPGGTLMDPGNGEFQFRDDRSDATALVTNFPMSATYTITTTGTDAGSVAIANPGGSLADYLPATPVFTISGVTGSWTGNTFTFDPTGVTSFTVAMSRYSVPSIPGGMFGYGMGVVDNNNGFNNGDVGDGPVNDSLIVSYTTPVFTFNVGAAFDNSDGDDSTFGIINGESYRLEANVTNITGLGSSGLAGGQQAFLFGSNTAFNIVAQAVPEPATWGLMAGLVALVGVMITRRRRMRA